MEILFYNNIIIIYFIVCISIFTYESFSERQKITIIYLVTYLLCFANILDAKIVLLSFISIMFFLVEYFTNDKMKIILLKNPIVKLKDFIYMSLFQYDILLISLAIILQTNKFYILSLYFLNFDTKIILNFLSFLIFIVCLHRINSHVLIIKSMDQLMKIFNEDFPINIMNDKFTSYNIEILTLIEDKSYFVRKNSYNFVSIEFIKYKFNKIINKLRIIPRNQIIITSTEYYKKSKNWRGYSTLEMQLMRNVGILSGYNNRIYRKIYELVYTDVFFSSLREYYENNIYANRKYFKEYLIWIYFKINHTTINGTRYATLFDAMDQIMQVNCISQLSDEQLFVLTIGLNNTNLENALDKYFPIICKQGLDVDMIKRIYNNG